MAIIIAEHPLAADLLCTLRDHRTPPERYRQVARRLTTLLVIEATRSLPTEAIRVQTPLEQAGGRRLGIGLAAVPVLRAGLGMLEPVLDLFPDVAVGYVGLERNDATAVARSYYSKLPSMDGRLVLCLDPMLATGGSACQAIDAIKERQPFGIVMVCVIAAPEGLSEIETRHPEVQVVTAALDRGLNHKKYILPGLGDFGDRLYGTF